MKKNIIRAAAVLAVVVSALAFKPFASGSVFCDSSCTIQKAFRVDPNGSANIHPCGLGNTEYIFNPVCTALPGGTKFTATTDQGN